MKAIIFFYFLLSQVAFAETLVNTVVKVNSTLDKQQIIDILKIEGVVIKNQGEKFILISPRVTPKKMTEIEWSNLLTKIKNLNNVISVLPDKMLTPKDNSSNLKKECDVIAPEVKISGTDDMTLVLDKLNNEGTCSLSVKCNDQSLAWAPMSIGADLAEKIVAQEVAKSKIPHPLSKTAVIDTGFDVEKQKSGLMTTLKTEKGFESAGDKNTDDGGHGTPVSGMVSGKHTGVTKHTNLAVYKITLSREGSASSASIAEAVEKACKENNDVVNLSWGSLKDEEEEIDPKKELWYDVAERMGCLIVNSSGNSGIRQKRGSFKVGLTDPYLSVEALDTFNEAASFSTSGMIASPGAGVFSLLSNDHIYNESTQNNTCQINGNSYGSINGTSFSSPAAAGVAAQIVTILKARGMIPTEPSIKIKIIKSILLASQIFPKRRNGINAYGAILIAQNITKDQTNSSIDELVAVGARAAIPVCKDQDKSCDNIAICKDKVSCVEDLRRKSFACDLTPNQKENLISTLNNLNEKKLVMGLIGQLSEKELTENLTYKSVYNKDLFEKLLNDADQKEKAFLLTKSTFQKNPKWEIWARSFIAHSDDNSAISIFLMNEHVQQLPEWETWTKHFMSKDQIDSSTEEMLTNKEVQKLPEWSIWAKKYLQRIKQDPLKIIFLRNPMIQKSAEWKAWAIDFLKNTSAENKVKFLKLPDVLQNDNWEELANIFWDSTPMSDSSKIDFLKDPEIQQHPSWPRFVNIILSTEKEVPRISYLLRDENVQKLPRWHEEAKNFMKTSSDDTGKAYFLTNLKVQNLPEWNEWVNNFISTAKNDNDVQLFLLDPHIQKLPKWNTWAINFIKTSKDEFAILSFLKNTKVQQLPEWQESIYALFDKPKLGYVQAKLLLEPTIQKLPIWDKLAQIYLKKADPNYLGTFLLINHAQEMPEWNTGVINFIKTSSDDFAISQFLLNSDMREKSNWVLWVTNFLETSKGNDVKINLLSDAFVLRHPKWKKLAQSFIEKSENEDDVVLLLKNEYVQKRSEWKELANRFLETTKNEVAKANFLESPNVQKLLR